MKKILCILLSFVMLLTALALSAGARTVIELTDEEIENGKNTVWDWYKDGEPMCRWKTARARILNPEGWNEIADELIYASNGQFAARDENIGLLYEYWEKTGEKGDDGSVVLGDLNKNGKVDVVDARLALRIAVGLEELPENMKLEEVDVSINDKIDVEDARLILREAVGCSNNRSLDMSFGK